MPDLAAWKLQRRLPGMKSAGEEVEKGGPEEEEPKREPAEEGAPPPPGFTCSPRWPHPHPDGPCSCLSHAELCAGLRRGGRKLTHRPSRSSALPHAVGCVDPEECTQVCGTEVGCANIAYPKLVMELMPSGLRGLMVAVMMAALMSSLTSIFNSSSALFTMDIWRKVRQEASEKELLLVGRVVTVVLVVVSVVWLPILQSSNSGQLYIYIQSVTSYLAPPVTAVFLLAVFWKRANEQGAFWGLMVGLAVGLSRMVLEFAYPVPRCGVLDHRPSLMRDLHYLHFAPLLCLLTAVIVLGISCLTPPPTEAQIKDVTWWTRRSLEALSPVHLSSAPSVPGMEKEAAPGILQPGSFCIEREAEGTPGKAGQSEQRAANFWSQVCSTNAVILLCVNLFFYAYFA